MGWHKPMTETRSRQIADRLTQTPEFEDFPAFAAKYFKVLNRSDTSGRKKAGYVNLVLNPVQLDFYEKIRKAKEEGRPGRFIVLKARRMGLSTVSQAYMFHQCLTNRERRAFVTAADEGTTNNIFMMAKSMLEHIPRSQGGRGGGVPNLPDEAEREEWLANDLRPEHRRKNDNQMWLTHPNNEDMGLNSRFDVACARSTKSARGFEVHYFHGCLAEGTPVLRGEVERLAPIETFRVGDLVRTHTGAIAPISFISTQTKPCLEVRLGLHHEPLVLTPEHKVWTLDGMKPVDELGPGDVIGFPVRKITDDLVRPLPFRLPPAQRPQHGGRRAHLAPETVLPSYEIGRVIGLYLAEGSISLQHKAPHNPSSVTFAVHEKDVDRTLSWLAAAGDLYSSVATRSREGSKTVAVVAYGVSFAKFMLDLAGKVDSKRFPARWWEMGEEFVRGLLHGYIAGDGGFSAEPYNRKVTVTSVRESLTYAARDALASLGYGWASVRFKPGGLRHGRNERDAWILNIHSHGAVRLGKELSRPVAPLLRKSRPSVEVKDGYAWIPILSMEDVGDRAVYDFEVDHDDHSYCTAQAAVSNSEIGFWDDAEKFMLGIMPTFSESNETLIVLESTANGAGGYFHDKFWRHWKGKGSKREKQKYDDTEEAWESVFYAWWQMPFYVRKLPEGMTPTEFLSRMPEEIVEMIHEYDLTPEQAYWAYRTWKDKMEEDWDLFRQEYPSNPHEAFAFSASRVFAEPDLRQIEAQSVVQPGFVGDIFCKGADGLEQSDLMKTRLAAEMVPELGYNEKGPLWCWGKPKDGHEYILFMDVASGRSTGDYTAIQVIDMHSRVQAAEWWGQVDPHQGAQALLLLALYYNDGLVVWETNGPGHYVSLAVNQSQYWNVYVRDQVETIALDQRIGWVTNSATKPLMVATGEMLTKLRAPIIRSKRLMEEMRKFLEFAKKATSTGGIIPGDENYKRLRTGAPVGDHDDLVIAWLGAQTVLNMETGSAPGDFLHTADKPDLAGSWERSAGGTTNLAWDDGDEDEFDDRPSRRRVGMRWL